MYDAGRVRTTTFLGLAAQLMNRSRAKPNSSDGIVASTTRGPFGSFSYAARLVQRIRCLDGVSVTANRGDEGGGRFGEVRQTGK